MARAYLTRRALLDIGEIDLYSTERWGGKVAEEYLASLYAGVGRLEEMPDLLEERTKLSLRLRFYRVREHLFVCDVIGGAIYVLAVCHGAMDLPSRIAELEPQLVHEARFLHDRIAGR